MAHTYLGNGPHSKRSYISTAAFNNDIWAYQKQMNATNFKNEGRLVAPTIPSSGAAVTAALCPAGRILREAGRKLFPYTHPGLVATDTWNGVAVGTNISYTGHMMVLVFDAVTGLKGYIDPNNEIFAVYNSDRANDFVDAAETVGGPPTRLGQSIYTAGNMVFSAATITLAAGANAYNFVTNPGTLYTCVAPTAVSNLVPTVPTAGSMIIIRVVGQAAAAAVTFSAPFKATATAAPAAATNVVTVSFISDGTNLIEVSRASV
jgi:hypothetical protein